MDDPVILRRLPLVVVDVETTGLSPGTGDRVCEVAAIRREPGGPERVFQSMVDPGRSISPGAYAVNGITPEMLCGAPVFAAIIDALDAQLENAVFVAHNAPFDLGFLQNEYRLCRRSLHVREVVDTRLLARRFLRLPSNSLASVARHFRVRQPRAHRAVADCQTTLRVLDALIDVAESAVKRAHETSGRDGHRQAPEVSQPAFPDALIELLTQNDTIEIVYLTASGTSTRQVLRNTRVVQVNGQVCLQGYCAPRETERNFRLDRVLEWHPVTSD